MHELRVLRHGRLGLCMVALSRVHVREHMLWPRLNASPSLMHSSAAAARMWLVVLCRC